MFSEARFNILFCIARARYNDILDAELPSSEDEKPGGYHGHKPVPPTVCEMARVNNADRW